MKNPETKECESTGTTDIYKSADTTSLKENSDQPKTKSPNKTEEETKSSREDLSMADSQQMTDLEEKTKGSIATVKVVMAAANNCFISVFNRRKK